MAEPEAIPFDSLSPEALALRLQRHQRADRRVARLWVPWALAGVLGLGLLTLLWRQLESGWQQQDLARVDQHLFVAERELYARLQLADQVLQDAVEALQRTSVPGEAQLRKISEGLPAQQARLPAGLSLQLLDAQGLQHGGREQDPGPLQSYADQAFFVQASQSRGVVLGPPLRARQGQGWLLPLARRLETAQHTLAGVVWISLDLDKLGHLRLAETEQDATTVFLMDADGNVLGRGLAAQDRQNGQKPQMAEFRDLWNQGQRSGTFSVAKGPEGGPLSLAFKPLSPFPLIVAVAESDAPARAERQALRRLLQGLGLVLVLAWLASAAPLRRWQLARRSERALLQAQVQAARLLDGLPGALGYWDRALNCRFANPAAREGYGQEAFRHGAPNLRSLLGDTRFAQHESDRLAVLEGQPVAFESSQRRLDGSTSHSWTRYAPDLDPTGAVLGWIELSVDVTPLQHNKQQLELADSVYRNISEGILVTDARGVIQSVNAAFSAITGYSAQELVGQPQRFLRSSRHDAAFYARLWQTLRTSGQWKGELWNVHKSGDEHLLRATMVRIQDSAGQTSRYVAVFNDITDLWRKDEFIRHQAYYDALTDLPNRALLMERMDRIMATARRQPQGFALLFMDLDGFKRVNDVMGHDAGDELLKVVAHRLEQLVRQSDTVARLGGDEFVLLLDHPKSQDEVLQVAQRVIRDLNQPIALRAQTAQVGVSIGIAFFPKDGRSPRELLKHADAAMYRAKEAGKNSYHLG